MHYSLKKIIFCVFDSFSCFELRLVVQTKVPFGEIESAADAARAVCNDHAKLKLPSDSDPDLQSLMDDLTEYDPDDRLSLKNALRRLGKILKAARKSATPRILITPAAAETSSKVSKKQIGDEYDTHPKRSNSHRPEEDAEDEEDEDEKADEDEDEEEKSENKADETSSSSDSD